MSEMVPVLKDKVQEIESNLVSLSGGDCQLLKLVLFCAILLMEESDAVQMVSQVNSEKCSNDLKHVLLFGVDESKFLLAKKNRGSYNNCENNDYLYAAICMRS